MRYTYSRAIPRVFAAIAVCALTTTFVVQDAQALPGFGDIVNAACTAEGRDPLAPYDVDAATQFTSDNGCKLCHENGPAGDAGAGKEAMGGPDGPRNIDFFCVVVQAANQPPVFDAVGDQNVDVNVELSVDVQASDPDADDILTLSIVNPPTGSTFEDNGDGTGVFTWTPPTAGSFETTFNVTDNGDPVGNASENITITVNEVDGAANQPPVLSDINDQTAIVGEQLQVALNALDPEDDAIVLSAADLPAGAEIIDNGDGTGTLTWTPQAAQTGSTTVQVTATDAGDPPLNDSKEFAINVSDSPGGDVNTPPELAPIGNQSVLAGEILELTINASDGDGNTLRFEAGDLPDAGTLTDNGDGSAQLSWQTGDADIGQVTPTVVVTDDGTPNQSDSETFTITVNAADGDNQPPILEDIGSQTATEGVELSVTINASDPDGDDVTITVEPLPDRAVLEAMGNGVARFIWTPNAADVGNTTVLFRATDDAGEALSDTEEVIITVDPIDGDDVNRAPVLTRIGKRRPPAGARFRMTFSAQDANGDALSYVFDGLPAEAEFTDNGDGTASLFWFTTNPQDKGVYELLTTVSDGELTDSETSRIEVREPSVSAENLPPVFNKIGNRRPRPGTRFRMTVTAKDSDAGDSVTLAAQALPAGAEFVDGGDGSGVLTWSIPEAQTGEFVVSFSATDAAGLSASESSTISVQSFGGPDDEGTNDDDAGGGDGTDDDIGGDNDAGEDTGNDNGDGAIVDTDASFVK